MAPRPFLRPAVEFLSTPSARRATYDVICDTISVSISIHALREEGDHLRRCVGVAGALFLSTPSARRATTRRLHRSVSILYFYPRPPRGGRPHDVVFVHQCDFISIHALREEGDQRFHRNAANASYFYPRPPRGGRLYQRPDLQYASNFYPRPPRGGRLWDCRNQR